MSRVVDTFTFTENGGGVKKEININLGDIVAREAAEEALQKSAGAPTDNYDVNRIILACSTMDGNDAVPLALPDGAKFRLYVNRDGDSGTFTDLEIENADDSGEVHALEHGYNWIYWSSLDVAMNLYVNIGVLEDNFITVDDVIDFAFTSATTSEASIALMTALYGIYSAENAISISFEQVEEAKEVAQEAKEEASSALDKANGEMITQDPTGEYIPQMLVLNADGSVYKGDLQDLSVSGGTFNGLSTRIETKYFKLKSPEGLQIIGYLPGTGPGVSGKYKLTPNTVSVRQNISLLLYEDLLKKQEAMNQERNAQNLVMGNYMIHGKTPMMVWRNEGDTHYTVEYEKKWADTPNMFQTDDGKLQDILMLDCEGVSTFYKAFELVKAGFLKRKLRSVKGICNYGNVASFERMFYKSGGNIEEIQFIPEKVTKKVKVASMFGELRKLTSVNIEDVEFTSVEESAAFMFVFCGLQKLVMPALPGVVNIFGMFQECYRLEYLDMSKFDFSNVTDSLDLSACYRLEHLTGIKNMKKSCKIGNSPLLTYDSIMNVINGLYDLTVDDDYEAQSLALHSNAYAKLSDEDIEIATNKGWNVVEV